MKPTHVHLPTGKLCSVISIDIGRQLCNFGEAVNPFVWVVDGELQLIDPVPADTVPALLAALQEIADGARRRLRKGPDSGDSATLALAEAALTRAGCRQRL